MRRRPSPHPHPCRFQTVVTAYPPDLDAVDGRIFSPTSSGSESVSPTPAFPVSPETPYGKNEAGLSVCSPAWEAGLGWRGPKQLLTLLSCPVTTSPRYPPFSPSGPQMGSASSLYKGAHGKKPTSFPLLGACSGWCRSVSTCITSQKPQRPGWLWLGKVQARGCAAFGGCATLLNLCLPSCRQCLCSLSTVKPCGARGRGWGVMVLSVAVHQYFSAPCSIA